VALELINQQNKITSTVIKTYHFYFY